MGAAEVGFQVEPEAWDSWQSNSESCISFEYSTWNPSYEIHVSWPVFPKPHAVSLNAKLLMGSQWVEGIYTTYRILFTLQKADACDTNDLQYGKHKHSHITAAG